MRAKSCERALVGLTQSEGLPYAVAVTLALRFAPRRAKVARASLRDLKARGVLLWAKSF